MLRGHAMFDDFFEKAGALQRDGVPFATATVVRAEKPTSGKPGDKAIVTLDGVMYGWIGGSCAQPTVVREARRAIADDRARLIRLSPQPENEPATAGVEVCRMTCYSGGTLDVYIEPQAPRPHLLVVGHLPTARALVELGRAMRYRVSAVVPPGEQAAMAHADTVASDLATLDPPASPLTYVVIATHGHDDEEATARALRSGAPYVALVASPKRAEQVRRYLRLCGHDDAEIARLRAPAGLDIGARRGDEIALSIMAEIVQHRRSAEVLDWRAEPADDAPPAGHDAGAVDPVCGMRVDPRSGKPTREHDGIVYHFCCAGCAEAFAADPGAFVVHDAPAGSGGER